MLKTIAFYSIQALILTSTLVAAPAYADSNQLITYQGRIVRSDGSPLEGNVLFTVKIFSPAPANCLLWAETQTLPMVGSLGVFSMQIGRSGFRIAGANGGAASNFNQAFINNPSLTISSANCDSGSSYTPALGDDRSMSVSFTDAGQSIKIADLAVKSAPFAMQAEQIGGYSVNYLMKIAGTAQAGDKATGLFARTAIDLLWELSHNHDFGGQVLHNAGTPTLPNDVATKAYVDSVVAQGGTTGAAGTGTVTAVGLVAPTSIFTVANSPVTTFGSLSFSLNSQSAGLVFASPAGSAGVPSFRGIAATDIPALDASKITSGTLAVDRGGTGLSSFTPYAIMAANMTGSAIEQRTCANGEVLEWQTGTGFVCVARLSGNLNSFSGTLGVANGGTGLNAGTAAAGQLLIGNGTGFSLNTLTAGTGIAITNSAGSISISALAGTIASSPWTANANGINYSAGSVGIGIAVPTAQLDVRQNISSDMQVRFDNMANGYGTYQVIAASSQYVSTAYVGTGQEWRIGMNGNAKFRLTDQTSGRDVVVVDPAAPANALYVEADGNIGAGVAGPFYSLSFKGDSPAYLGVHPRSTSGAGSPLTVLAGAAYLLDANLNGGDLLLSSGMATGTGGSNIQFQTTPTGTAGTSVNVAATRMFLSSSGRLGLGTTDPEANMEIRAVAPALLLSTSAGTLGGNIAASLTFKDRNNVTVSDFGFMGGRDLFIRNADQGIRFGTGNVNDRVTFNANGRVGIGIQNASVALDVVATGSTGSAIRFPRDTTGNRPWGAAPADLQGMMRYNTDLNKYEVYEGSTGWASLQTGSGGGGGGGTALTCPTNFTPVTAMGAQFCIKPNNQDNGGGASLGSVSTSNVGNLIASCKSVGGYVCSYAQLMSAQAAGTIAVGNVSGTGSTYNGAGAFTSESMFAQQAIAFDQNGYCPSMNGNGDMATAQCSQTRSYFCCR